MQRLGGLTILLSLLVLVRAIYDLLTGGADGLAASIMAFLLVAAGISLMMRFRILPILGGLIAYASALLLARALREIATSGPHAPTAAIVAALLIGGLFLLWRRAAGSEAPSADDASDESHASSSPPPPGEETSEAVFSVVQTGDDRALNRVERLLETDPRITDIVSECGRWHATPDRNDLPEWNALRVYCARHEIDQVMAESEKRVAEKLGPKTADKVTFSRFS